MEAAPSAEVIRATQDSLGKFVKRPPLTEKLLKKPPFRFLHDIITSVLKSNGFFDGLFEETELISENVKDREAKILFLTKVISILNLTTGKTLTVKPSKIISGQEPEKTNEMLQCLGLALEKKLSTDEAVKKYKQNTNAKINKKSQDESLKKLPNNEKNKKERGTLKSKSNETLTKQADIKDSNKEKREDSISRKNDKKNQKDTSMSRRDTSTSRKENQKDKPKIVKDVTKEKTKNIDRSVTKQKSSEKLSKVSPPKQNLTNEIECNNLQIIGNDVDIQDNKFEMNELEPITSDSNLKSDDVENVMNVQDKELIYIEDSKSESKHKAIENHSSNNYVNGNNDINVLITSTTINEKRLLSNTTLLNVTENINIEQIKDDNSAKDDKIVPIVIDKKTDIDTETISASQINNQESVTTLKITENTHNGEKNKSVALGNNPGTPMVTSRNHFLRPPSSRPPSSRPGAPRLRDKHDSVLSASEDSPVGKVHVIVENGEMDAEEDETSLVFVEPQLEEELGDSGTEKAVQNSLADHGHLVRQILDSQKEFNKTQAGKTEIEWEFGAQRARQTSSQDVEQLRFNLQALSRAANPLGKLLDHIQEDVEVMRQELQQWTKTYEDAKAELAKEKSGTEQALLPLQAKSKQLEEEITDKRDKINDLKSIIHKNSARIDKLLANGNVQ